VNWIPPVDLDNCATEPIHIPGSIQPHGALIAVTADTKAIVRVASANCEAWWGVSAAEMIGRPLGQMPNLAPVAAAVGDLSNGGMLTLPLTDPHGWPMDVAAHSSGDLVVIEAELRGTADPDVITMTRDATLALQLTDEIGVAERAAKIVRELTGFDRVMVYRFDAQWNGEVIAEDCRADLNRFLGLHYPCTDIPAQAREMYRRNWIRTIPDIAYTPVALLPGVGAEDANPLDLSSAALRSVSPIHVEYLTNMGVTASMSVSLIWEDQLWGLIACHHYSGPLHPSSLVRGAAEFVGQLASIRISQAVAYATNLRELQLSTIVDRVSAGLSSADDSVRAVAERQADDILELAGANSAAIVVGDDVWPIGSPPSASTVRRIGQFAARQGRSPWTTDRLGQELADELGDQADELGAVAGALVCSLTPDWADFVVWFRDEQVRQVDWGGDPTNAKLYAGEGDDIRLSPRKSFDLWSEVVRGTSVPWTMAERRAAARCTQKLSGALLREQRVSREVIETLQQMFRPGDLPDVPGYGLDAWYQPAGRGQIGGDWFDAFPLTPTHTAMIVGDVSGHGVRAAAEMTQLRHMLRAYLLRNRSTTVALELLDVAMLAMMPGTLATCVCAVVDRSTGQVTISHAGHLPALCIHGDGTTKFADAIGDQLLGLTTAKRTEQVLQLEPGDTLVMYSDGLIEQRERTLDDGLARLAEVAATTIGLGDLHARTRRLLHVLDGDSEDDVCVLAIERG